MGQSPLGHYYEISQRGTQVNAIVAALIWVLTVISKWGDWRGIAIIAMCASVAISYNIWANALLPRFGQRLEVGRLFANLITTIVTNELTDWPLPCWLWLPFNALAFDQSGGRWTFIMFTVVIGVTDVAGLLHGEPWVFPLMSTLFAIYAWQISELRVSTIRDMLLRSDNHRLELASANAKVSAALEELQRETSARERVEIELRAAQQLEALGRIAAGVAHEINTPIQFVGDNLRFLKDGLGEVFCVRAHDLAVRISDGPDRTAAIAAARAADDAADMPYLMQHLPEAVSHALDGVDRVAAIVASMRQFARPGGGTSAAIDLNEAITATLTVSRNEYKLVADIETDFARLPLVTCNAGEINQVLLNIVVNAAHAVSDAVGATAQRGTIRLTTVHDGDDVVISIRDSGTGIPAGIRDYIFDPFFTTKEVGRGTGQGLAIARAIIERHCGRLTFDTEVGRGTTFHIRIPIHPPQPPAN